MMKKEAIVDRIEGKKAVLITDDEETVILPAAWLPHVHEGMAVDMDFTEILKERRRPWKKRKTFWRKSKR